MVTNAELAKEMKEQKERNRLLEEMKTKLEEVAEATKKTDQEGKSSDNFEGKANEEDIIP